MREIQNRDVLHRVKGRPVLERRLYALLRSVHRFARARATTPHEVDWAGRMVDALTAVVQVTRADTRQAPRQPGELG
jgi:hypothetical protein